MTGFFIKDLMMLKCQKQFFFIMGIMALIFLVMYDNPSFVFGYLTIMFSFIPITTLSYDDADNGSAYLFSLPVSRVGYVIEKYAFSLGFPLTAALVSFIVVSAACRIKGYPVQAGELGVLALVSITVAILFLSVAIPVQIRFGSERSRMAAGLTFAALFAVCYAAGWVLTKAGISLEEVETAASGLAWPAAAGLCILAWIVIYGVSFGISAKILKGKDF